ncbi:MAG: hypothetical protein AAFY26_14075 [Cyanobacteria bacterium J06638_22]
MKQLSFDFESDEFNPDEAFGPPNMARIFVPVQSLSSQERKLLAYLKEYDGLALTDKELVPILFPKIHNGIEHIETKPISLGEDSFDVKAEARKKYTRKVKKVVSGINATASKRVAQLESRQDRLEQWSKEEVILVVGETERGEVLRAYHGPEKRLSMENLRAYLEWATTFKEKQSQPYYRGLDLWEAASDADYTSIVTPTITTDYDTPDEAMDAFLKENPRFGDTL